MVLIWRKSAEPHLLTLPGFLRQCFLRETKQLSISYDTQRNCLLKIGLLESKFVHRLFRHAMKLKTVYEKQRFFSNGAAYQKCPLRDPSDHASYRNFLIFTLSHGELSNRSKRKCLHEYETWSKTSAQNINKNVVPPLNGSNGTSYPNVMWTLLTRFFLPFS